MKVDEKLKITTQVTSYKDFKNVKNRDIYNFLLSQLFSKYKNIYLEMENIYYDDPNFIS